jgi:hypothetical protein
MSKKNIRTANEPSWSEVILGAVLSVALGGLLGVVLLAIKPVAAVKELPKEPVAGMIYYVQGSRDSGQAKQAAAKRKLFAQGTSVTVTEDEINSFLPPPPPLWTPSSPKAKAGDKPKAAEKAKAPEKAKAGDKAGAAAAPAAAGEMVTLGGPNFHLHDGKVQIAVPVTISVLGFDQAVTVVADGSFVKKAGGFAFEAETLYLDSCPVQRVPFATGFVANKFIGALPVPEDVMAAWPKLAAVAVEGNALKLTMP